MPTWAATPKKQRWTPSSSISGASPEGTAGLALLKSGGAMAIALYYGKENGYAERDAILSHVRTLDDRRFSVLSCDWANRKNDPPLPVFIWKE